MPDPSARTSPPAGDPVTRSLLRCGVIAGPLFVSAFLIEGATRAGYDPMRHPISSLSLGHLGWTQVTNFLAGGLLTLGYAAGLRRALRPGAGSWGIPLTVAGYAAGLIGAGLFTTDPVGDYPPGAARPPGGTTAGQLHDLLSLLVFLGLPVLSILLARWYARRGRRGRAVYAGVSGAAFLAAFAVAAGGFGQAPGLAAVGGLSQRIALVIGWTLLGVLALDLLRGGSAGQRRP
ncbi:hypothetical protein Sru01_46040 [Sphaerisporangium rufum]|uniref:DUF998 domain-containing protein n=1 Tax=Sphaerisporangium rufum TaxID=1381558 RepID=A0A919R4M9_9ACTN|nr:DUF998 domain-containing protein [Sphaerisporangium rufum]GII79622.1 hypothetical protein Sru01_46040 [Sphaerisporangium rufum]